MSLLRSFDSTGLPKRKRGDADTNQPSDGEGKSNTPRRKVAPKRREIPATEIPATEIPATGETKQQPLTEAEKYTPSSSDYIIDESLWKTKENIVRPKSRTVYFTSNGEFVIGLEMAGFLVEQRFVRYDKWKSWLNEQDEHFRMLEIGKLMGETSSIQTNGIYLITQLEMERESRYFGKVIYIDQQTLRMQNTLSENDTFTTVNRNSIEKAFQVRTMDEIVLNKLNYRTYIRPDQDELNCYNQACSNNRKAALEILQATFGTALGVGIDVAEFIRSKVQVDHLFMNGNRTPLHMLFGGSPMDSLFLEYKFSNEDVSRNKTFVGDAQIIIFKQGTYDVRDHDFDYNFYFWDNDHEGLGQTTEVASENIEWLRANHEKVVCIMTVNVMNCNAKQGKLDRHRILMRTINTWVAHGWSILLFYPKAFHEQYEICAQIKQKQKYKDVFRTVPYELINGTCNDGMVVGQSRNAILKFAKKFGDMPSNTATEYNIMKSLLVIDERVDDIMRATFPRNYTEVKEPEEIESLRRMEGFKMLQLTKKFIEEGYEDICEDLFIAEQKESDSRWDDLSYPDKNAFRSPNEFYNGVHTTFSLYHQLQEECPSMLGVIDINNFRRFQKFDAPTSPNQEGYLPNYPYNLFEKTPGTHVNKKTKTNNKKIIKGVHYVFKPDRLTQVQNLILIQLYNWNSKLYYPYTRFAEDIHFGAQWSQKVSEGILIGCSRQLACVNLKRNMNGQTQTRMPFKVEEVTTCGLNEYAKMVESSTYEIASATKRPHTYVRIMKAVPKCTWHYAKGIIRLKNKPARELNGEQKLQKTQNKVNWQTITVDNSYFFQAQVLCQLARAMRLRGLPVPQKVEDISARLLMFFYDMKPERGNNSSYFNKMVPTLTATQKADKGLNGTYYKRDKYEDYKKCIEKLNSYGMLEEARRIWINLAVEIYNKEFADKPPLQNVRGKFDRLKVLLAERSGFIQNTDYKYILLDWPNLQHPKPEILLA